MYISLYLIYVTGQVTGGLLNAWFGNVVEMLLCVAGLRAVSVDEKLADVDVCKN